MFFFEKKNQKTLISLDLARGGGSGLMNKSLFASFFSEKEDSGFRRSRDISPKSIGTIAVSLNKFGDPRSVRLWGRIAARQ